MLLAVNWNLVGAGGIALFSGLVALADGIMNIKTQQAETSGSTSIGKGEHSSSRATLIGKIRVGIGVIAIIASVVLAIIGFPWLVGGV